MKSFVRQLLLLLLSSCLLFSPAAPAASQERATILDSDGNSVRIGERYLTAVPNGSSLGTTSANGGCPPNVSVQTWTYGPPVMLFPKSFHELGRKVVYADEVVSVMFASDHPSPCPDSLQWTLNRETELVTTGGAASDSLVSFSRFMVVQSDIVGAGPRYNFWSCPSPSIRCSKLGVVGDEKLLGVSEKPLEVEFIKVKKEPQGLAAA